MVVVSTQLSRCAVMRASAPDVHVFRTDDSITSLAKSMRQGAHAALGSRVSDLHQEVRGESVQLGEVGSDGC